jgi:hypothetical protein
MSGSFNDYTEYYYSDYIKNLSDRGTYREVKDVLRTAPAPEYPAVDTTQAFQPGVFWGNNFRLSFLRFRALNVPRCVTLVNRDQTQVVTAYEGNKTITSYLQG